jgi:hypothetical protein
MLLEHFAQKKPRGEMVVMLNTRIKPEIPVKVAEDAWQTSYHEKHQEPVTE